MATWQRELLDFALEHAQGRDERLFLPRTKFGQTLERACARAGIPRCTPNDLRRTYSTWLRADGVPNELSAPTMGHKDTRMLDRVYARLPPELLRARLLAALGRCSKPERNWCTERTHRTATRRRNLWKIGSPSWVRTSDPRMSSPASTSDSARDAARART